MSFWRTVLQFQKEKIAPRIALRNTLGFALPLAAGIALGSIPAALIASIGALNVSYSDSHDPKPRKPWTPHEPSTNGKERKPDGTCDGFHNKHRQR